MKQCVPHAIAKQSNFLEKIAKTAGYGKKMQNIRTICHKEAKNAETYDKRMLGGLAYIHCTLYNSVYNDTRSVRRNKKLTASLAAPSAF